MSVCVCGKRERARKKEYERKKEQQRGRDRDYVCVCVRVNMSVRGKETEKERERERERERKRKEDREKEIVIMFVLFVVFVCLLCVHVHTCRRLATASSKTPFGLGENGMSSEYICRPYENMCEFFFFLLKVGQNILEVGEFVFCTHSFLIFCIFTHFLFPFHPECRFHLLVDFTF